MTEASGFGVLLLRVLGSITARFGGYRTIGKDRMTNLSVYGIASLFKVFTNPNPWYEALAVNLAVGKHIGTYPKKIEVQLKGQNKYCTTTEQHLSETKRHRDQSRCFYRHLKKTW